MRFILVLAVLLVVIGCGDSEQTALSGSEKNGQKAVDIYVSFFKSYVNKDIPEEEQQCLIDFINELDADKFVSAGKPITNFEDSITFEKFNEDVKSIEFFPNGKLSSDFDLVQPVAQVIEMMSNNACKQWKG